MSFFDMNRQDFSDGFLKKILSHGNRRLELGVLTTDYQDFRFHFPPHFQ